MNRSPWSAVINGTLYQVGWFACVLGAAWGWGTAGASLALLLIAVHLLLVEKPAQEWPLLAVAGAIGLAADTLHGTLGVVRFAGHEPGTLAPLWIVALWIHFGTVLHFCMRWLSRRYILASILGLIGGPLSFLGGERLGAAAFGEPRLASMALLGLTWSVALPLLVAIADRLTQESGYRSLGRSVAALGFGRQVPVRVPVRTSRETSRGERL